MMGIDFLNVVTNRDPSADNFGVQLFRLITKADKENLSRLGSGFPAHVDLFLWWYNSSHEPTEEEILRKAKEIEKHFT